MLGQLKRNDTNFTLNYTITENDGSVVNLTGATVSFIMGKKNTLITNSPATIVNPGAGTVQYAFTAQDTVLAGNFLGEFLVSFSDGTQKTYPSNSYIAINIQANLDNGQSNIVIDSIAAKTGDFEAKLDDILARTGNSNPEIVDARGSFVNIGKRFDDIDDKVFYDEIKYDKYRDATSSTDYYITYVPNLDANGNFIKLEHGYQNDLINSGVGESARSFANRHVTSLTTNASIWDTSTGLIKGVQIQNGVIKKDKDGGTSHTLGIKADNTLVTYASTVSAATILADGCVNAITGFFPLILNSVAVSSTIYNVIANPSEPHDRNVIAQLPNKDLLFLTCEGGTTKNTGMTYADVIRILLAKGVTTAYCLDGGGSAQTNVRGMTINTPGDVNGTVERAVADFLYISQPTKTKDRFQSVSTDLGIINRRVTDVVRDMALGSDVASMAADLLGLNRIDKIINTVSDCNTINDTNIYWCISSTPNAPTTASSWGILHIKAGATSALQIAFPYHATVGNIMLRRTNNSMTVWTAWRVV